MTSFDYLARRSGVGRVIWDISAPDTLPVCMEDSTKEYALEVVNTIMAQLGKQTMAMLGAKSFGYGVREESGNPYLKFRIQGSTKVTHIEIEYTQMDWYRLNFYKMPDVLKVTHQEFERSLVPVKECDMVYDDMLHRIIETETGLYTRL